MISSIRGTACGFSILAITAARPRVIFLASAMSSGRCTNDSPIQSMPASSAASRSERSFGVSAENGMMESGRLTPLRSESLPPTSTRTVIFCLLASVATRRILPSSSRSVCPALHALEDFRMRQVHARRVAGLGIGVEREARAVVEHGRAAGERRRPAASVPADRPGCRSAGCDPSRPGGSRRPARACGHAACGSC